MECPGQTEARWEIEQWWWRFLIEARDRGGGGRWAWMHSSPQDREVWLEACRVGHHGCHTESCPGGPNHPLHQGGVVNVHSVALATHVDPPSLAMCIPGHGHSGGWQRPGTVGPIGLVPEEGGLMQSISSPTACSG
jgi:hypothetical protein